MSVPPPPPPPPTQTSGGAVAPSELSFLEVSKHFSLPIADASAILGVCTSVLKRICRENGVVRWPYRKFLAGKTVEEIQKEAFREKKREQAEKERAARHASNAAIYGSQLQCTIPPQISQQQQGNRMPVQTYLPENLPGYVDEFKQGFPSNGLLTVSVKWWGTREADDNLEREEPEESLKVVGQVKKKDTEMKPTEGKPGRQPTEQEESLKVVDQVEKKDDKSAQSADTEMEPMEGKPERQPTDQEESLKVVDQVEKKGDKSAQPADTEMEPMEGKPERQPTDQEESLKVVDEVEKKDDKSAESADTEMEPMEGKPERRPNEQDEKNNIDNIGPPQGTALMEPMEVKPEKRPTEQDEKNHSNDIGPQGTALLSSLRKRAAEEGRELLKLGVSRTTSFKLGRKEKQLLLKVFESSLPSQWAFRLTNSS